MSERRVSVDVVSDVVCPWCYLGKRRLERALTIVRGIDVVVRWRPYRLDPTIPPEGMDRTAYVVRKFGSVDALAGAHQRLVQYGRDEGVDYRFDLITRSPNTIDAHRLARWAALSNKEGDVVERLFAAYFTDGRDVGDPVVLAAIATEAGLDGDAIGRRLATDDDRRAIAAEIEDAYQVGVTGVPTFIIDQRYAVTGAHSAETIASAIRQAAAAPAA